MLVGAALRLFGARCDLPERYGKRQMVHRRFSRWCHAGAWDWVFQALTADWDNQYLMIDSTIVRAHQQAATVIGRPRTRRAFPRGLTTKTHMGPRWDVTRMVPLAGLEPACLAAFDFESNASTNFATGAAKRRC